MKVCTKCKKEKDISCFAKDKTKKDGLRPSCKLCASVDNKQYYIKNKSKILISVKVWQQNNPEKVKAILKKHNKKTRRNVKSRISESIGGAIWKTLKKVKNGKKWQILVGYTLDELIQHLEKQFTEGMTWDNYGKYGWHIDHKIPINYFYFNSLQDDGFKKCWELSNLQPLWARDNIVKGHKILYPLEEVC